MASFSGVSVSMAHFRFVPPLHFFGAVAFGKSCSSSGRNDVVGDSELSEPNVSCLLYGPEVEG